MNSNQQFILRLFLSFVFPPLAVYCIEEKFSKHMIINIILFILGYIPGVIHSLFLTFMKK